MYQSLKAEGGFLIHTRWCNSLRKMVCSFCYFKKKKKKFTISLCFLIRSCWFSCIYIFAQTGFTTQQAEVLVKILVRMTNSNMDVIYNDMVTKVQQVRLQNCILYNKHNVSTCLLLCVTQRLWLTEPRSVSLCSTALILNMSKHFNMCKAECALVLRPIKNQILIVFLRMFIFTTSQLPLFLMPFLCPDE